jgi:hypothetical protein
MASRPVLGPNRPPIQWVPEALSLGVKRLGREADHSSPASAEFKKAWSYASTLPVRLHGVVLSLKKYIIIKCTTRSHKRSLPMKLTNQNLVRIYFDHMHPMLTDIIFLDVVTLNILVGGNKLWHSSFCKFLHFQFFHFVRYKYFKESLMNIFNETETI